MAEIKLGSTGNWERVNVNGHNSRSHHGSLECCSNKLQGQPSGGGGFAGVGGGTWTGGTYTAPSHCVQLNKAAGDWGQGIDTLHISPLPLHFAWGALLSLYLHFTTLPGEQWPPGKGGGLLSLETSINCSPIF